MKQKYIVFETVAYKLLDLCTHQTVKSGYFNIYLSELH